MTNCVLPPKSNKSFKPYASRSVVFKQIHHLISFYLIYLHWRIFIWFVNFHGSYRYQLSHHSVLDIRLLFPVFDFYMISNFNLISDLIEITKFFFKNLKKYKQWLESWYMLLPSLVFGIWRTWPPGQGKVKWGKQIACDWNSLWLTWLERSVCNPADVGANPSHGYNI